MSNVRITATGDEALSVEVLLGDANRAWHDLEAGDSVDLAVGGNQTLSIGPARENPSIFVTPDDEPAVETPWVEGENLDLPVGVDVLSEAEVDVIASVPGDAEVAGVETESAGDAGAEAVSVAAEDVGSLDELFGGAGVAAEAEAEAEAEVVKTLETDAPLQVGSIADLPSAFDSEEEAEDKDSEAQA